MAVVLMCPSCIRMSSRVDALVKTWLNTANFLDLVLVKRCDCLEGLRFRLVKKALIWVGGQLNDLN